MEQANSWKTLGFVQTTLADYSAGWEDYAKALRLFRTTGDLFNQEVMLENRGDLSRMTGDYEGALQDATAASKLALQLNDRVGELHIEDEIGAIHLQRGEMQSAFEAFEQVLGLEQLQPGDPMIGFAETDLAQLYRRLDAPAQARDMLSRADAFWAAHPCMLGQLDTLTDEGEIEADSGDLPRAAAAYRRGLELAEPARMKREMVFCLLGLGTVEEKRGKDAVAAASFQRASQLAAAIDEFNALARIHTAEGDLALSQGRLLAARQDYRQALDVATQTYDHTDRIRALGGLADAEFRSGDYASAHRHIELALDGIESTRDRIVPGSLQTSYFSSWHSYYALAIRDLMRLAALHPGAGWEREALDTAERGRARFLLEQVEEGGSSAELRADPALAASRSRTLRELHLAESTLVALRAGNGNSARVQEPQSRVAGLKEREDRIEAAVYRESAADRSLETAAGARSLLSLVPRIQSRPGPHTALLEYWTDQDASYLWAIGPRSLRAFTLPGSLELRPLASSLTAELASPFARAPDSVEQFAASLSRSTASFDATSARLARLILPPHSVPAGTRTLLVVGDGPLLSVPFAALRLVSTEGQAGYLQDKYTVVSEPSIGVLLALLAHPQPRRPMKVAVIADPVFSTADPRLGGRVVRVGDASPGAAGDGASLSAERGVSGQADWTAIAGVDDLHRLPFAGRLLIPGFALATAVLLAAIVFAHWSSHPAAQVAKAPPAATAPQPRPPRSVRLPGAETLGAAVVFFPQHLSRGTAQPAPLQLRLDSQRKVELELELPATASAGSAPWSVTIRDAHGIVLVRRGLRARQFDAIPFVSTSVDASAFAPGSYRVSLSQMTAHPASTEWDLKTIR